MAEKLTVQQKQAVNDRGGRLLVSAAAGSGKTKVLVDRLLSYLTDPRDPANLDEFLIITFTKAAAAELRGKIAAKLTERIAEDPQNRHLQQQMQRLYLAKISTVHAFCADVLRQYAYQLDIPADFRVAEDNECAQLRLECMERLLDKAYDAIDSDPDFCAFVDSQGMGRDDKAVPEILLKVYDSARCHLDPDAWLDSCVENGDVSGVSDVGETVWGKYLMERLFSYLDMQIGAMNACMQKASQVPDMSGPVQVFADNIQLLQRLRSSESWDELSGCGKLDYGTLSFSKKCSDPFLAENMKAVRNACKKGVEKQMRNFANDSASVLEDMQQSCRAVRGIVALVKRFSEEYDRAKRVRRIMDFGDLEHRMLDLLLGRSRTALTRAAREIGDRFREVMVDEYQDSNAVQDAIYMSLTEGRQNCFMVGDVKQSIYQFRLADPGIFLKKYTDYQPAENVRAGQGRKVLLSKNFRSGGAVLDAVNDVFEASMSEEVGGLVYGKEERLEEGVPHEPLGGPEVELYALDVQENTYEEEAAFVAGRIRQMLDEKWLIRDKDGMRAVRPEDIAILLRSPKSVSHYFRRALEKVGIRCAGGEVNLLQTEEIATVRAILQTVSNPRQDIPLLATLASPVFGFTADELAALRSENRYCCFYDALAAHGGPKAKNFVKVLGELRRENRMKSLTQLLEFLFAATRLDSLYGAMPDGDARKQNLETFYQLAAAFESGGQKGLERFLDHLQALEGKGLVAAGELSAGAVTVMSIHKSKGLEFPVVFVCSLSRRFSRESVKGQVLCDQTLGLGLVAVDKKNRVRYPTVAKRAVSAKILADGLSEDLRVLYVALTRARDRLIMTYASGTLEKDLRDVALRMDGEDSRVFAKNVTCPGEWVLYAALSRTEAGELFALCDKPEQTKVSRNPWLIKVVQAENAEETAVREQTVQAAAADTQRLQAGLSFRYCWPEATFAPSKQTATQRKGREKDIESAEAAPQNSSVYRTWRKAAFGGKAGDGRDYGNAYHAVMEHIRYEVCGSADGVSREIDRLVREQFLAPEQAQLVDSARITAFFETELGRKMADGETVREFKFSVLDSGEHYGQGLSEEKVLLQGVVDCALIEPDGISIVDFKTDHVTEQTVADAVQRYRPQVEAYATAMARIYARPVKGTYLYFFGAGKLVRLS